MRAMILAAGRGTRMAPLSARCAKPALPVLDEPLVLRLARQLADAGVEAVIVNAHAHVDSVARALDSAPIPVEISREEPELLGSGGGIAAARAFLDAGEPFLVINGDMVVELDWAALLEAHRGSGAEVTLALRDDGRKGDFGTIGYDSCGRACRITTLVDLSAERPEEPQLERGNGLFIGVHVMEPSIFGRMPGGAFEIVPDVYVPALRDGAPVGTWLQPPDQRWLPVGSPAELLDANLDELERSAPQARIAADARVEGELDGDVWIGAGAHIERGARVGPRAVVGARAHVPAGVHARHSLWLPDARPSVTGDLFRAVAHADEV